ncbi:cobalt ECF transporter T component CbiQ [Synergistales bacterium]|nr:cobalt ECF transporter T component CbiQ [Synergistales bacterium]
MPTLRGSVNGIDSLERLAMGKSPIHRLHPAVKLATTIAYVITVLSFPSRDVSGLMAFIFYPAIIMPIAGIPYRLLMGRLMAALPFSLMGGASNLFFLREPAFVLGSFSVTFGMLSFVSIMQKTLLSVLAVLILAATTPFADITRQLTRLGMPRVISLQFVMTYRYLFALISEAYSMFTAYTLRSPQTRMIQMKDMGSFLGQLVLRSFDRGENVYQAMKCRGFQGVYNSGARFAFRFADAAYSLVFLSVLFALRFFNLSVFLGELVR